MDFLYEYKFRGKYQALTREGIDTRKLGLLKAKEPYYLCQTTTLIKSKGSSKEELNLVKGINLSKKT